MIDSGREQIDIKKKKQTLTEYLSLFEFQVKKNYKIFKHEKKKIKFF